MRLKGKKPIFNYKDCWSLDETLSPIICAGLMKFKEELVKHPFQGYPSSLEDSGGFEKWLEILDKMIYAFDLSQVPDIRDYDFKFDFEWEDQTLKTIEPDNEDEYNRFREDEKNHAEMCEEGRELFGKYFHSLWL